MKSNKRQSGRFSAYIFILLFVLVHLLSLSVNLISPLLVPLFIFFGQGILLKLQFGWSFRRWFLASVAGLILVYAGSLLAVSSASMIFLQSVGSVVVVAILQSLVLGRYVRNAWLWLLGTVTGFLAGQAIYNPVADLAFNYLAWNLPYIGFVISAVYSIFLSSILASILLIIVHISSSGQSNLKSANDSEQNAEDALSRLSGSGDVIENDVEYDMDSQNYPGNKAIKFN